MTDRERESARWVWLAGGGRYGDDSARDGGMVVAVKRTEVVIENLTGLLGSVTQNGNDRGNANGNGNGNFSLSGNYPYPMFCYKEHYHPKCDVCKHFISTNAAGLTEYRAHPFWVQKYCPFHEHDGTPWCCSCERMEDKIAKKLAEQSQPGFTNPQSEVQVSIDVLGKRSGYLEGYGIRKSTYAT
ncbi:hypothetical protein RHGRI_017855 [Rhododendron griersonianum]|uniref:Uncharacterized protein n=1 Tax=Rhododendron griersonianum TaxID=479676 RepID=A0AAV6JZ95_9ERIC|nr:hypothetical protein RHGRI_017855 [Rhododendron griersonianum]